MNVLICRNTGFIDVFVSRIFSALFSGIVSRCYGFNIKRPSIAQWLSVSIPFSPVLENVDFDAIILFWRIN